MMKIRFSWLIVLLLLSLIAMGVPAHGTQAKTKLLSQATPTLITPTIYCLGGVPCTSPDPTATTAPSAGSGTPVTSPTPSEAMPSTSPTPSTNPCDTQSSIQHDRGKKHKKHNRGNDGGFLSKLFEFLMQLLEMLFKQFGITFPTNPNPEEPTPMLSPEEPIEPTPCPDPTSEQPTVEPTNGELPTVNPTIEVTPTIFGTTPSLSPTGTTYNPADTIFVGDYETGNVSQWPDCHTEANIDCSAFNGSQHNIKAVTNPVRQGKYAGRFELRDGEGGAWSGNERTETLEHIDKDAKEGAERWYQWSTQFTPEFAQGAKDWAVVTQWHDESDGSPPLSFDAFSDGTWGLIHNGIEDEKLWGTTHAPGTWHDMKLHVIWSADASKGLIEVWHNGQKQTFTGGGCSGTTCKTATLRPDSGVVYVKQGIYRKDTNTTTAVIFHDGFSIAKTEAGLKPLQ